MSLTPTAAASPRIPELNWTDAHRAEIQMRYSDIDTNHHVNNGRYGEYLENARIMMFRDLNVPHDEGHNVLARMELDYVQEIHAGQKLVVESLVERIGRTSVTVVARILADGVACAFSRVVLVNVDDAHRPREVGAALRSALAPTLVRP
ncbi:acyl-CoA thioesterase [Deinococcus taklimakanensis]|uniref:Acyl-CoA thioesterase n=1 Tax=Deinococcus taklimakanensis TaxID=536443 RepID=A0ABW5P0J7_9DEIO